MCHDRFLFRSAEVGKQLAEVLLSREQGQRPVTLIGYSLGARVIYYCLREMSERDGCEGIVQDAILLGTPVTGSTKEWNKLTRVVSGRLVNGYSKVHYKLVFFKTIKSNCVSVKITHFLVILFSERLAFKIYVSNFFNGKRSCRPTSYQ